MATVPSGTVVILVSSSGWPPSATRKVPDRYAFDLSAGSRTQISPRADTSPTLALATSPPSA